VILKRIYITGIISSIHLGRKVRAQRFSAFSIFLVLFLGSFIAIANLTTSTWGQVPDDTVEGDYDELDEGVHSPDSYYGGSSGDYDDFGDYGFGAADDSDYGFGAADDSDYGFGSGSDDGLGSDYGFDSADDSDYGFGSADDSDYGDDDFSNYGNNGDDDFSNYGNNGDDDFSNYGNNGDDDFSNYGNNGDDDFSNYGNNGDDDFSNYGNNGDDFSNYGTENYGDIGAFGDYGNFNTNPLDNVEGSYPTDNVGYGEFASFTADSDNGGYGWTGPSTGTTEAGCGVLLECPTRAVDTGENTKQVSETGSGTDSSTAVTEGTGGGEGSGGNNGLPDEGPSDIGIRLGSFFVGLKDWIVNTVTAPPNPAIVTNPLMTGDEPVLNEQQEARYFAYLESIHKDSKETSDVAGEFFRHPIDTIVYIFNWMVEHPAESGYIGGYSVGEATPWVLALEGIGSIGAAGAGELGAAAGAGELGAAAGAGELGAAAGAGELGAAGKATGAAEGVGAGEIGAGAGKAVGAAENSGTVWDSIKPTSKAYPNTEIPQSFVLETEHGSVWVNPSGTKHIAERAGAKLGEIVTDGSNAANMLSQAQLTSLQSAVSQALAQGIKYGELINVGGWELKFARAQQAGQSPILYHALQK